MSTPAPTPNLLLLLYGEPKRRKTSSLLAAFPNALCIGVRDNLLAIGNDQLGFSPRMLPEEPRDLDQLLRVLRSHEQHLASYGEVIVDDISLLCKTSMVNWRKQAPRSKKTGKADGFYPYKNLEDRLTELADLMRHSGCKLAVSAHERKPKFDEDTRELLTIGGPEIPMARLVEDLPAWCDVNIRAVLDNSYEDPWTPRVTFYAEPDDKAWITGSRISPFTRRTPASIREALRASATPYVLRRLQGFEWQDDVADTVAEALMDDMSRQRVQDIAKKLSGHYSKLNPLHLRWAIQDGVARAHFRRDANNLFDFSAPTAKGGAPPPPPDAPPSG